jgi:hypothetical protein
LISSRPSIDRLLWDEWNRDHIAKHAVLPEEAEEVIAGFSRVSETYKQRLQFVGPTVAGRMLSIVVGAVPDRPGVKSAERMNKRKEARTNEPNQADR